MTEPSSEVFNVQDFLSSLERMSSEYEHYAQLLRKAKRLPLRAGAQSPAQQKLIESLTEHFFHNKELFMKNATFNTQSHGAVKENYLATPGHKDSFKVYVFEEPDFKVIIPKSGTNVGKQVSVVNFKAYKRNFQRDSDGSFSQLDPTFIRVSHYGEGSVHLKEILKKGMALRLDGKLDEVFYTGKDGEEHSRFEFIADNISLDLLQLGLQGVDFEKPESPEAKSTKGGRGRAGSGSTVRAARTKRAKAYEYEEE